MAATTITDSLGQIFDCSTPPQRVVSLVPSITETLYDIGVFDVVVGVTRYCVHPSHAMTDKTIVGGTKQINLDTVQQLKPDLVLCNQEENTPEMIESLASIGIPCHVSFPTTINTAIQGVLDLGRLFGQTAWTSGWTTEVRAFTSTEFKPFHYAYFIWRKPWMLAGQDTFITEMLKTINGINIAPSTARYPEIDLSLFQTQICDLFLLSSEPFPFQPKHHQDFIDAGVPPRKVQTIDGESCSWHGTRLLKGLQYLKEWRLQMDEHLSPPS